MLQTTTSNSVFTGLETDVQWLHSIVTNSHSTCEWSGCMTKQAREKGTIGKATEYLFVSPIIDATPLHPDTVLTTLVVMEKFIQSCGQTICGVLS